MTWIARQARWIMLASGLLTCTMLWALVAPEASQTSNFGSALTGPIAEVVVRNWGALIGLVGAMLVYGAFHPPVRRLVLAVAGTSKLTFIGLVALYGRDLLAHSVRTAVIVDAVFVVLYAILLASLGTEGEPRRS
jgi:hypothetical protein